MRKNKAFADGQYLTMGDLARAILDRDDVIKDLPKLLDDLAGEDVQHSEVYQRGVIMLSRENK
jgi:hypothetical protein